MTTAIKERPILFNGEMVRAILDGRIVIPKKVYGTIHIRLMNGIEKIDDYGCWIWGRTISAGYGCLTIDGKTARAHVASWQVSNEMDVPSGKCVCHHCDNPLCINPKHLFLGTRSDNMRDMVRKGRHGGPPPPRPGESNPASKLTLEIVSEIRSMIDEGNTQESIARKYKISQTQVSNIKRGLQWK